MPITENNRRTMNIMNVLGKVYPNGVMFETIYNPSEERGQLVVREEDGSIHIESECSYNGNIYCPLTDSFVTRGVISLSTGYDLSYGSRVLLACIDELINRYVELEPGFQAIASRYVLMTWVYECFQKVPYLRLMGKPGTGKSRFLDVLRALCYHGSTLGEGINSSSIYRILEKYPGSLFLDEADFTQSDATQVITQILNGGYDRSGGVIRQIPSRGGDYEPHFYSSFGPKILASRYPFSDPALESRCLTGTTQLISRNDIPRSTPDPFHWEEMIEIRNRLLGFRLNHFSRIKDALTRNNERQIKGIDSYDPRLAETLLPLFQITGEYEFNRC